MSVLGILNNLVRKFVEFVAFVFIALLAISFLYKGVALSQEHLPEIAHLFVLLIYVIGLSFCISLMATEAIRKKQLERIKELFGPNGLLFLPVPTLIVAA